MRVVKNDNPKEIILNEVQRKISIQFIAAHNAKIEKQEKLQRDGATVANNRS